MVHYNSSEDDDFGLNAFRGGVLGTYLGLAAGILVFTLIAPLTGWLAAILGTVCGGGIAGIIQCYFLGRAAPRRLLWVSINAGGWTVIAIAIAVVLGFLGVLQAQSGLGQVWPTLIVGGTGLSVVQWWLLRRSCSAAGWWVLINCGTWAMVPLIYPVLMLPAAALSDWL